MAAEGKPPVVGEHAGAPATSGGGRAGEDERHSLRQGAVGLPGLIAQSLGVTAPEISAVVIASVVAASAVAATPLALIVGGIGAVALGLIYSRFARYVPHAGGTYAIVRSGLGANVGFFAGWTLLAVGVIFVAGLIISAAFLLQALCGPNLLHIPFMADQWVWTAVVLAVIVLGISYLGVSLSARVLLALTTVGVTLLLIFGVIVLAKGGASGLAWTTFNPSHISTVGFASFAIAVGISMTAFSGFETAVFLAEEAQAPRRQVPKAVIGAVLVALVFYVFIAFSILSGYGLSHLGGWSKDGPFAVITLAFDGFVPLWYGKLLLGLLALSGSVSALGTANFTTRVAFSWGRDGYLPRAFARTHRRFKSPSMAIGVLGAVTAAIFAAGSAWKGQSLAGFAGFTVFSWLLLAGAAAVLPVYILVALSGLVHGRRTQATLLYGWIAPVVAVIILGTAEYTQFHGLTGPNRWAPWVAVAWMAAGVVVRLVTRHRVRAREIQFDAAPAEPGLQSADQPRGA
jgi:amino acid transporter